MRSVLSVAAAALTATACADAQAGSGWTTIVDTLPSGTVHVVNTPPANEAPSWQLHEELRIGSVDGEGPTTFGEIKALVVDSTGRIIVLESQAQEVRVFEADGQHFATYGGKGGGPGEFESAFGLMQATNGLLYVPDQRNARMSVLSVDSGFLRSYPLTLLRWGYIWDGVMRHDDHILVPSLVFETRRGLVRIYSPDLTQVDSVLMPEPAVVNQSDPPGAFAWSSADEQVSGYTRVPFFATGAGFLDKFGMGWASTPGDPAYRIHRMTLSGDTTLRVETRRSPLPVTVPERDSAMNAIYEGLKEYGVTRLDASKIPPYKPTVLGLFTDDGGALWVQTSSPDSLRRYDVYSPGGEYRGSVVSSLNAVSYLQPVVRGDEFYAVVLDELDVPYVVRARIHRN